MMEASPFQGNKEEKKMVWLLRQCIKCYEYTLNKEECNICGRPVKVPHPAKFSMDDPYQRYKLKMRRRIKLRNSLIKEPSSS
jgi:H/ACA ribonucleoprotein complex subunit 3